jgi:hypothetical protein
VAGSDTETVVRDESEGVRLVGGERDAEGEAEAEPEGDTVALRVTHAAPPSATE